MLKHCHSCAAPLEGEFKGPADNYCKYCADEGGKLHPREQIQQGIAGWLKSWDPDISQDAALKRAANYMLGMPAWAED